MKQKKSSGRRQEGYMIYHRAGCCSGRKNRAAFKQRKTL